MVDEAPQDIQDKFVSELGNALERSFEDIYDISYKVYQNFNETGEFDEAGFEEVSRIFEEEIKKDLTFKKKNKNSF